MNAAKCTACGKAIEQQPDGPWLDANGGYCMPTGGALVHHTTAPADVDLANAVREALEMLDREEHRYVERFVPCPEGCTWDYDPFRRSPELVQKTGPDDCEVCDQGVVEDENAEHLDPFIDLLRKAAARLAAGVH